MNRLPEQVQNMTPLATRTGMKAQSSRALAIALFLISISAFLISMQLVSAAPQQSLHTIAASAPISPLSQVFCVDDGGGATGAPCANATAFTLIQDGVAAAAPGDEVRVAAGTYVATSGSTVVDLDRAITLTGGYPGGPSGWGTPGDETLTVIDGQGVRNGISVSVGSGNTIVAQNLSVVNGGIVLNGGATLNNNMPVRTRDLSQSLGVIGGSATISVTNSFAWSGGIQTDPGHTDVLPGAQLSIAGNGGFYGIQNGRVINNFGTGTWSGTSDIRMNGGAVFNNQAGATFTIQNSTTLDSAILNNFGTLTKTSAGDTSFFGASTFNNDGLVQIQAGRLVFGNGSSTGTFDVAQGATLAICNCGTQLFQPSSVISGAGTFDSTGPSPTIISGTFTLPNLVLTSGDVHFDSVGANTATSVMTLTMTSGSLDGSRTISVTNLLDRPSGLSSMDGSGHTDILPGAQANINAGIFATTGRVINNFGTANFITAGFGGADLQLSNATFNNGPGGVVNILNDGFLQDNGSSVGHFNNFGTIIRSNSGGTATISFGAGGSSFVNSGLVEVQTGILHFVGFFSQTTSTTRMAGGNLEFTPFFPSVPFLQGGTLEGAGTVTGDVDNPGGTVSPGLGPGLMTITGDYTQGSGGTLSIELGGLTPVTEYDRLAVGGTATLAGTLNTSTINGFTPQIGDSFTVLTYGSRSGTFSSILGGTFTANYNPNDLTLVVGGPVSTATPPPSCLIQFSDVPPGSTFYPFIRCLACRGIINGYPCGGAGEPCDPSNDPYFRPGNNVTRGQFSKIASNSAGFNDLPDNQQQYEDVVVGSTFYDFIWRLTDRGLVNGYPCGGPGEPCGPNNLPYFRPNSNVTRGQLSKIDANAAGFNDTPGAQQYEDVLPGSTFFDFIWRLSDRGIINGYPCGGAGEPCGPYNLPYFRPGANATRGQASKIVANTFFPNCQTP